MLATEFAANMLNAVTRPPALGRVFYVNHTSGLNTNNGLDPGTPFHDITHALGECVNNRNDYIVVVDCYDAEPGWPIVVNKTRVHIIGMAMGTMIPSPWLLLNAGAAGAVFMLDAAHDLEIAGFSMGGGAGQSCIEFANPCSGIWIHHCSFGCTVVSRDGILAPGAEGAIRSTIEDCLFEMALTRDGIQGNMTRSVIRNNIFRRLEGGIGINTGGEPGSITGNCFYRSKASAGADGWAITLSVLSAGGIIMNNYASETGDNSGNNPYRDISAAGVGNKLHGWANNYKGNALSPGPAD